MVTQKALQANAVRVKKASNAISGKASAAVSDAKKLERGSGEWRSKAKDIMASAEHAQHKSSNSLKAVVHANSEIKTGKERLHQAEELHAKARKAATEAKVLRTVSEQTSASARAVLEGLPAQRKSAKAMIASAGKLTGANPIVALAKTQLASTNTAENNAKVSLAGAKRIMLKSEHLQKQADTASKRADSMKSIAEKQTASAQKEKERINDPTKVGHLIAEEVGALKAAAARDVEAVTAMKESGKKG